MDTKDSYLEDLLKAADREFGTTAGYNSLEDSLKKLDLMDKGELSPQEARELARLKSRQMEPGLARRLTELGKDREEKP